MPIYFGLSRHSLPLMADSIGNRWNQEHIRRSKGFPLYHWLQTEQGVGEVVLDGKPLPLPQGSGVLIAPFVPHDYYPKHGAWVTSFVTFSGDLASEISKIVGHAPYLQAQDTAEFSFGQWVNQTIRSHEAHQLDPVRLSIGCYTFLMHIQRLQSGRDSAIHPLYQQYIAPTIKEIETNFQQDLSVRDLAGTVYISPQYLSRLFKRFLGMSTYAYLTNYRMDKAKELLTNLPGLEIRQVGYRVGYPDTSHFIAVFKDAAGATPLEFRRMHL